MDNDLYRDQINKYYLQKFYTSPISPICIVEAVGLSIICF